MGKCHHDDWGSSHICGNNVSECIIPRGWQKIIGFSTRKLDVRIVKRHKLRFDQWIPMGKLGGWFLLGVFIWLMMAIPMKKPGIAREHWDSSRPLGPQIHKSFQYCSGKKIGVPQKCPEVENGWFILEIYKYYKWMISGFPHLKMPNCFGWYARIWLVESGYLCSRLVTNPNI